MKYFKSQMLAIALGTGLAITAGAAPQYHDWDHSDLRGLIQRTQNDLTQAAGLEHGKAQGERYQHAEDELSGFDRGLSKGHFNRERLDHSIEKIQSVLDHNTLEPGAREALRHDLEEFRVIRDHRDH